MAEVNWELVAEFVENVLAGREATPESALETARAMQPHLRTRGTTYPYQFAVECLWMRVHAGELTLREMCERMRDMFPTVTERARQRYRRDALKDMVLLLKQKSELDILAGEDKEVVRERFRKILDGQKT